MTVLPGATIGDGSVIGAGSVVEGDIPAGVVAAGAPARVLSSSPERTIASGPRGSRRSLPRATGRRPSSRSLIARAAARSVGALAQGAHARDLRAALRLRGVDRLGAGVEVDGPLFVTNLGYMEVRTGAVFSARSEPIHLSTGRGATLVIGSGARIGPGSGLTAHARVEVGDGAVLESRCMVIDTDFHGFEDRNLRPKPRPIVVGRGARLGAGTIVLKGVTIGRGPSWTRGASCGPTCPLGPASAACPPLRDRGRRRRAGARPGPRCGIIHAHGSAPAGFHAGRPLPDRPAGRLGPPRARRAPARVLLLGVAFEVFYVLAVGFLYFRLG